MNWLIDALIMLISGTIAGLIGLAFRAYKLHKQLQAQRKKTQEFINKIFK